MIGRSRRTLARLIHPRGHRETRSAPIPETRRACVRRRWRRDREKYIISLSSTRRPANYYPWRKQPGFCSAAINNRDTVRRGAFAGGCAWPEAAKYPRALHVTAAIGVCKAPNICLAGAFDLYERPIKYRLNFNVRELDMCGLSVCAWTHLA
jgi:hypothetical protein